MYEYISPDIVWIVAVSEEYHRWVDGWRGPGGSFKCDPRGVKAGVLLGSGLSAVVSWDTPPEPPSGLGNATDWQ